MPIITQYFEPSIIESDGFKGSYTLIRSCDMSAEMKFDAMDMVASACEEYPSNNEVNFKIADLKIFLHVNICFFNLAGS